MTWIIYPINNARIMNDVDCYFKSLTLRIWTSNPHCCLYKSLLLLSGFESNQTPIRIRTQLSASVASFPQPNQLPRIRAAQSAQARTRRPRVLPSFCGVMSWRPDSRANPFISPERWPVYGPTARTALIMTTATRRRVFKLSWSERWHGGLQDDLRQQ